MTTRSSQQNDREQRRASRIAALNVLANLAIAAGTLALAAHDWLPM